MAAAGKSKDIQWSDQCEIAFKEAKAALAGATLLDHPSPFASTVLSVDASDIAVGAELAQFNKVGAQGPIAFFSKTLSPAQKKYSAFDREL